MNNYATIEDYIERYGAVKDEDVSKIEILLTDASSFIRANGGDETPEDYMVNAYKSVCCAMVHRIVESPSWAVGGITQHSQTAGSMNESFSFSNPNGDMFITKSEKKTLKLSAMKIGSIHPMLRGDRDEG